MESTPEFQLVSVAAKVTDPAYVPSGKVEQDLAISDTTGSVRFTVWEEEIGTYHLGKSYNM